MCHCQINYSSELANLQPAGAGHCSLAHWFISYGVGLHSMDGPIALDRQVVRRDGGLVGLVRKAEKQHAPLPPGQRHLPHLLRDDDLLFQQLRYRYAVVQSAHTFSSFSLDVASHFIPSV